MESGLCRLKDDIIDFRTILDARMQVNVFCVGLPHKKFPERMIRSSQYIKHLSKRKKHWTVTLPFLYSN